MRSMSSTTALIHTHWYLYGCYSKVLHCLSIVNPLEDIRYGGLAHRKPPGSPCRGLLWHSNTQFVCQYCKGTIVLGQLWYVCSAVCHTSPQYCAPYRLLFISDHYEVVFMLKTRYIQYYFIYHFTDYFVYCILPMFLYGNIHVI